MDKKLFSEALQEACKLWKNVNEIVGNLSDNDKLSDDLRAQFKRANEYLKHRVKWL